jgi:hypothetical protein
VKGLSAPSRRSTARTEARAAAERMLRIENPLGFPGVLIKGLHYTRVFITLFRDSPVIPLICFNQSADKHSMIAKCHGIIFGSD